MTKAVKAIGIKTWPEDDRQDFKTPKTWKKKEISDVSPE